jgi:hypothetical protein
MPMKEIRERHKELAGIINAREKEERFYGGLKEARGRLKKKDRVDLERRLIGSVIREAGYGRARDAVSACGVSWRRFCDRRHQAVWRALETLDLKSVEERMDILEAEMRAEAEEREAGRGIKGDRADDEPDVLLGLPGSAARMRFRENLVSGSSDGLAWLERALDASGALGAVGGKSYLRELAEIGEGQLYSVKSLAEYLFGR